MFVNLMNIEEKKNFLELVYKIANCDGEFSPDEEELINSYKMELGINDIPDTKSIDELIASFSDKEIQIKKVVFFELYGMIMADGKVADAETAILDNLKNQLSLDEESYTKLVNAAEGLQKAYDAVYSTIFD
jgi:uncharacterized tellurite resistance protein B-like protein